MKFKDSDIIITDSHSGTTFTDCVVIECTDEDSSLDIKEQILNTQEENKHLRVGIQAHRDALDKSEKLYKMLKFEFEDLAKEDNEIRRKVIGDIKLLKAELKSRDNTILTQHKVWACQEIDIKELADELETYKMAQVGHDIIINSYPMMQLKLKRIKGWFGRIQGEITSKEALEMIDILGEDK